MQFSVWAIWEFLTRFSKMCFFIQHYNADLDVILAFSPIFWNFSST